MDSYKVMLVLADLFSLRLALPLLITISIGYGINRLVDHWNAEIEL